MQTMLTEEVNAAAKQLRAYEEENIELNRQTSKLRIEINAVSTALGTTRDEAKALRERLAASEVIGRISWFFTTTKIVAPALSNVLQMKPSTISL